MPTIKKAIIAAAGYGTRFLPATKVQPKEMLPIIDKPIIQYLVEEAVNSGIRDIFIITRSGSHVLTDHFDSNFELEHMLAKAGKKRQLNEIQCLTKMANFIYLRQTKDYPYGNASPLLVVRDLIDDDESFVYMFGDDLVLSEKPATQQLIDVWNKDPKSWFVGCQEVAAEETNRYGIIKLKKPGDDAIEGIVEKPAAGESPSRLAQFGRFILDKRVIDYLHERKLGKDNELWLTDAISQFSKKSIARAVQIDGQWLTTGDPLNYLKATVQYAFRRDDLALPFKEFLKDFLEKR